ncbi:MAG: proton-conducting transporter membrane subunit [Planctomycetota bacterium]
MLETLDQHILLAMVLLPAIGAAFVALLRPPGGLSRRNAQLTRFNATMFTMGTLCLTAVAVSRLSTGARLGSASDWLRVAMGLDFAWGLDAISSMGALGVAIIAPAAVLASGRQIAGAGRAHFAWLLLGEACLLGAMVSRDLLLLSFFADGAVVAVFFALGRRRALREDPSFRWLTAQMLASGAWWVGVLHLGWIHYAKTGLMSFATADLLVLQLSAPQAIAIGSLLGISVAVRAGIWPLSRGLTHALHGAPAGATTLLVGGVMKLGVYLAVAVAVPATLPHSLDAGLGLCVALSAAALVSAILCYRRRTVLDFLAASASLIGAMALLGASTGTAMGTSGAMFLMIAHAVSFAGLMLVLVSAVPGATTAPLAELVGLGRRRPGLAVLGAIWLLSMVAVPGLSAFVGASMVLGAKMTAIRSGSAWWMVVGLAGAFAVAMHTAQMVMLVLRILTGIRNTRAVRKPLIGRRDPHHAFRALGMTTFLLAAMLIIALGADLFEPAVTTDASRSLATALRRDTFPGGPQLQAVVGPWRRVAGQALCLLAVAGALPAMRSRRTWGVLGWLAGVQLAGLLLAALTGDRAPSFSYLTVGVRVGAASLVSLLLHALAVGAAMLYIRRTRREPVGRLGDLAGLASSHPGAAMAIGVGMWSLAGLAPTLGAMGWVMRAGVVVSAGWPGVAVGWALVRGLSAVACIRLIAAMLRPAPSGELFAAEPLVGWQGQLRRCVITAAISAIVVLGILPEVLMEPLAICLP